VAFLLYKNELGRMRDAASRGSLVANLDIGPIEYADIGSRPVQVGSSHSGVAPGLNVLQADLRFLQANIRYCDGFRMRAVPRVGLVPEPASESLRGTNPRGWRAIGPKTEPSGIRTSTSR
jgi:hypothetical protein